MSLRTKNFWKKKRVEILMKVISKLKQKKSEPKRNRSGRMIGHLDKIP